MAVGGALGTGVRLIITATVPLGWSTLAVNVVGCVLLGMVVSRVRAPGGQALVGTGVAGALTTFSGFAVESLALFGTAPLLGAAYWLLSLTLGVAGAAAGLRLGRSSRRISAQPDAGAGR